MRCPVLALTLLGFVIFAPAFSQEPKVSPWEKTIETFEKSDKATPPPRNALLFVGSSSIRGWKVEKSFPDLDVINRGFGGSQIADVVQFTPRIVVPYQPRVIIFYAGDNDIAVKKTAERVRDDFKSFVESVRKDLPSTRIVFLSIKPHPARWKLFEQQKKVNTLIEELCKSDSRLVYLDVVKPMLGEDGKPRAELFIKDGLHLNEDGYKLWTTLLAPHLK